MSAALPKLSYVLLSHNREQYIRAAIESAFAQEYEGELEYIFSDDCSTDNTFTIIQECVAAYKGPRRVVVTQTPHNCHLAEHTNHAVSFVESDWIVRADDDDYSAIDRCALIGRAIAEYPDCRYVVSGLQHFTDDEDCSTCQTSLKPCGERARFRRVDIREGYEPLPGHQPGRYSYKAWHMDVFRKFGPLVHDAYYVDDLICYHRANLMGCGVYIEQAPAVFVRIGSGNMCRGGDDNTRGFFSIIRLERFNDKYYNLTHAPLSRELTAYRLYASKLKQQDQLSSVAKFLLALEEDLMKRALWGSYWRKGTFNRIRIAFLLKQRSLFAVARCLPMTLFALVQTVVRKIKKIFRIKQSR